MIQSPPLMSREQRAAQIWSVLAYAATHRQIVPYGILAKLIGVPAAALGQLLKPIESLCIARGLPPLTVIVVSDTTGVPGSGFVAAADVPSAQMEVFQHGWLQLQPPTPNEYREITASPDTTPRP